MKTRNHDADTAEGLTLGLGWFSIAMGLAEIAAPRKIAKALGMRGMEPLVQAYGVREVLTGVGILSSRNPAPWLAGRLAGDALDFATLSLGLHQGNRRRRNVALAMGATAGVAMLDLYCARKMSEAAKVMYLPTVDYSDRHGFPNGLAAARGAAKDFDAGRDFRTPEALKPWQDGKPPEGLWTDAGDAKGKGAGHRGKSKAGASDALGAAVAGSASVLGEAGSTSVLGDAGSSPSGSSSARDDAFKTGPTFAGKGNEGP